MGAAAAVLVFQSAPLLAALAVGGKTTAVFGCGVDMVYPSENRKLYEAICEKGLAISEFPMGAPAYPQNFPIRNRIVSGMSCGVLVVEATGSSPADQQMMVVEWLVREGDTVTVGSLSARVIETPGHTLGQINYFFPADKLLFAGDTLFSIGCGRVIEGTPEMMWNSLLKLRDLRNRVATLPGVLAVEAV